MKPVTEKEQKSKMVKLSNINKRSIAVLAIAVGFYLVMALWFGPVLASDSKGYINMVSAREPIYPLFLLLFRIIFGNAIYLQIVVIVQSLLMAFAIWKLIKTFDNIFSLEIYHIALILLSFAGVAGICILFTARAVPYTNVILTEGLATSLWIFFIDFLINGIYKSKKSYIVSAILLTAIMMDIRKQMAIGYIVVLIVVICSQIFIRLEKKKYIRNVVTTVVVIGISILMATGITRIYNYVLRGEFAQNTRDMNLVLTTSLYVSDREDVALIEEEAVKDLFLKVCDSLEENKCTFSYAPKGLAGLQKHYSDSFDVITLDTTAYLFVDDAVSRGFKEGIEAEQEADRTSGIIVKSLLKDNLGKYVLVYISSLEEGFINTVAKRHPVLDWYALLIYAVYIGLIIYNCIGKNKDFNKALLGLIILAAICVNVGVTGALIFCQTRYMLYNMPLFYGAMVIMIPNYNIKSFKNQKV